MAKRSVTLYIEDSEDDAFFLKRAFKSIGYPGEFLVVTDGSEGQQYLEGAGKFADRGKFPLPDLIICDIKMPHVTGHEFVRWFRSQTEFANLPIFMFSSSGLMRDMATAMERGADRYFVKPFSPERWKVTAREMLKAAFEAVPGAFDVPVA